MERLQRALDLARKELPSLTVHRLARSPARRVNPPIEQISYSQTQVCEIPARVLRKNRILVGEERTNATTAYKMLRTQILQRMRAGNWNTLAITSPGPGVGKTLTAINLAISLAREQHHTVMLADLDLSKPSVHRYFELVPQYGIGDYLLNDVELPEILINPGIERLVLLPGHSTISNSSELLGAPKMASLVDELKHYYASRYILFDLPPLLAADDALAFSPYVDCILLVVEDGKTTKDDLIRTVGLLQHSNIIGTVLNRSDEAVDVYPTN